MFQLQEASSTTVSSSGREASEANTPEQQAKQEEKSPTTIMCRNTIQGPHLITDSRGHVCSMAEIDVATNCCTNEKQLYSCATCNNEQHCCTVYEYCVSCCLAPSNRELLKQSFAQRKTEHLYKHVNTVFQYCSTRCRTSSKSVVFENKYKTNLKHCFGIIDPTDLS